MAEQIVPLPKRAALSLRQIIEFMGECLPETEYLVENAEIDCGPTGARIPEALADVSLTFRNCVFQGFFGLSGEVQSLRLVDCCGASASIRIRARELKFEGCHITLFSFEGQGGECRIRIERCGFQDVTLRGTVSGIEMDFKADHLGFCMSKLTLIEGIPRIEVSRILTESVAWARYFQLLCRMTPILYKGPVTRL